jgi:hypothetical protein
MSGLGPPILQNINNGIIYSTRGAPQKDINSMCDADFAMEREKYVQTTTTPDLHQQPLIKKWFGLRDSSSIVAKRRTHALGASSINVFPDPVKSSGHNTQNNGSILINDTKDALRRVRSSGYVTAAKIRNKPANGLTPSWPAGPLIRVVPDVSCLYRTPKKVNSTNPYWTTEIKSPYSAFPVPVLGDPAHGQYTTMKQKDIVPPPPTITDTGRFHAFRNRNRPVFNNPTIYH